MHSKPQKLFSWYEPHILEDCKEDSFPTFDSTDGRNMCILWCKQSESKRKKKGKMLSEHQCYIVKDFCRTDPVLQQEYINHGKEKILEFTLGFQVWLQSQIVDGFNK